MPGRKREEVISFPKVKDDEHRDRLRKNCATCILIDTRFCRQICQISNSLYVDPEQQSESGANYVDHVQPSQTSGRTPIDRRSNKKLQVQIWSLGGVHYDTPPSDL